MALVDYSSSDEDEQEDTANSGHSAGSLKRKRNENDELPPLPSRFHDMYASTTRVSTRDDPSLHGGRKRVTPHIEGNWPTHLYIEWYPSPSESEALSRLISLIRLELAPSNNATKIHSFLMSDLGAPLPLHISLSRPIGFATEQKDGFVSSLVQAVKSSGIRPFKVTSCSLDWVSNFENTRWFLVLKLGTPSCNGLNKLLDVSNRCVKKYGQPPLYADPLSLTEESYVSEKKITPKSTTLKKGSPAQDVSNAFHISIAWTLSAPSPDVISMTNKIVANHFQDVTAIYINVSEIKAKVGNHVTNISLKAMALEEESLFGV
ncbi:U6 snRNA phosphodiesterase Usb1 [Tricladium varicosporioides]|nr:U6 snRNA phosphodiesterase Usb1 [Hymenoscyphus varicosporioides]